MTIVKPTLSSRNIGSKSHSITKVPDALPLFVFERLWFISAHFDWDELFGKCKSCWGNVKSERVGRANANARTHLASKKARLNKSIETFCSLASSLQVGRLSKTRIRGNRWIDGVQGMFTPTVLAAPGENNPRKSARIRAPVS